MVTQVPCLLWLAKVGIRVTDDSHRTQPVGASEDRFGMLVSSGTSFLMVAALPQVFSQPYSIILACCNFTTYSASIPNQF